jgi:RNA polymerase-binding protein DksA
MPIPFPEIRARLESRRQQLEQRLSRIQDDRTHRTAPAETDSAEQATQRENDEVLDALDEQGHRELRDIVDALHRMDRGEYGTCSGCEEPIDPRRLEVVPTTTTCIECSD